MRVKWVGRGALNDDQSTTTVGASMPSAGFFCAHQPGWGFPNRRWAMRWMKIRFLPRYEKAVKKPASVIMAGFFGTLAGKVTATHSCNGATTPYHRKKKLRCKVSNFSLRKLPKTALSGGAVGNCRHILSGVAADIFPEAIRLPVCMYDSPPLVSVENQNCPDSIDYKVTIPTGK